MITLRTVARRCFNDLRYIIKRLLCDIPTLSIILHVCIVLCYFSPNVSRVTLRAVLLLWYKVTCCKHFTCYVSVSMSHAKIIPLY